MLINEKYLKKYSPIPLNFNLDEVQNYVPVATKIWLIPLVGEDLVDELEEQIEANALSDNNKALLTTGGLWQYLAYATCYESLPFLWARISEVGIVKGKSDNSDSLDLKDLTLVQQHLRNQVEVLKEQLAKWLCQRIDLFPKACPCCLGCSCCDDGLRRPNPNLQLYSTNRSFTDIR